MPRLRTARALALSCHPLPTLAVTAISAILAALAGLPWGRGVLVTLTVFTGQLSIGWSNDFIDAKRDKASQRVDKPIAIGVVERRVVGAAAGAAFVTTLALSAVLGWPAGAVALVTVLSAWSYNLGLKATALSWSPYAFSFGLAPAIATLASETPRWPEPWVIIAFALLGTVAHFANVLPDIGEDITNGVRGLPHRIGARATAVASAALLLMASAVIVGGPDGQPGVWNWAGFAVTAVVGAAAVGFAYREPSSRSFFLAIIGLAVINLGAFALAGVSI